MGAWKKEREHCGKTFGDEDKFDERSEKDRGGVGVDVENYIKKMKDRGHEASQEVIWKAMDIKFRDEKRYRDELMKEKRDMRKEIKKEKRENSKPYRRLMKELGGVAKKVKKRKFCVYSCSVLRLSKTCLTACKR